MEEDDSNSESISEDTDDACIDYLNSLIRIEGLIQALEQSNPGNLELQAYVNKVRSVIDYRHYCIDNGIIETQVESLAYLVDHICVVHDKSEFSKNLIKNAFKGNLFTKNLTAIQMQEIVACMFSINLSPGSLIIKEGDVGRIIYVIEEGNAVISKNDELINEVLPGELFGEVAVLFKCRRTASVKAATDCRLWAIEGECFYAIKRISRVEITKCLKNVPIFNNLSENDLFKISAFFYNKDYKNGDEIIKQETPVHSFFIISNGNVQVTRQRLSEDKSITFLSKGDYFSDNSIKGDNLLTANIVCNAPEGTSCWVIDRDAFIKVKTHIVKIRTVNNDVNIRNDVQIINEQFVNLQLADLNMIATLGEGGFGRVDLIQIKNDTNRSFALKIVSKFKVVDCDHIRYILNERNILLECRCDFIVKLYKTFKDTKFVYMMMEVCLGGELWSILQTRGEFNNKESAFYVGCIVEAFKYLHSRNIVYRDLKPENLLLDAFGYLKLVDFGLSKKIRHGDKTYTICGTTECMAPEIILECGYGISADYWSLGVLIFELLAGKKPFYTYNPMMAYKKILNGIEFVKFPQCINSNATDLIKKLCHINPLERLSYNCGGITAIQQHEWFEGFNWEALNERSLQPPILPDVKSPVDIHHFDLFDLEQVDLNIMPEETSGWDANF